MRLTREQLRARRKYQLQQHGDEWIITALNGDIYEPNNSGRIYVRPPGGFTDGGVTIQPVPTPVYLDPSANAVIQEGRRVKVKLDKANRLYIGGNSIDDLQRGGINPRQLNPNDVSTRYKTLSLLTDLQTFPTGGDGTVKVMSGFYQKTNGDYAVFTGAQALDILTSYKPVTSTNQRIVALWIDEDTNLIVITQSSELSQSVVLTASANLSTAMTYINEAVASAPARALGVGSYIVYGTDTIITEANRFIDLRPFLRAYSALSSLDITSLKTDQLILDDNSELTISGGAITVSKAVHTIGTELDASSDDLDTISGTVAGEVFYLTAHDPAQTIVIKDGVDNITTSTGSDIIIDATNKLVFCKSDGTTVIACPLFSVSGSDISGPISSTDNAIVRWDGTGGNTIQDSGVTIDDNGKVSFEDGAYAPINIQDKNSVPSGIVEGDIYLDDGTNRFDDEVGFRWYNGSAWNDVAPTHSKQDAISNLSLDLLSPPDVSDLVLLQDVSNSKILKTSTVESLLGLSSGGGDLIVCWDEKATGVNGGTSASGNQTRTLNNLYNPNSVSGVSLSSNQLTLPAGTYWIEQGWAIAYRSLRSRVYIYNVTGSTILQDDNSNGVLGLSCLSGPADITSVLCPLPYTRFTLGVSTILELRHYFQTSFATEGYGVDTNDGNANIYAYLVIKKV